MKAIFVKTNGKTYFAGFQESARAYVDDRRGMHESIERFSDDYYIVTFCDGTVYKVLSAKPKKCFTFLDVTGSGFQKAHI